MSSIINFPAASDPIQLDSQLPGGEWGFDKFAPVTEEGDETADLADEPIDPAGTCARMGLTLGSFVAFESFIMEIDGFTVDSVGNEQVVVSMGCGGVALDYHLICRPEILEPVTTWKFRGATAPHRVGSIIPDEGQWLYVIRDSRQEIIYIGISVNAPTRWTQHQADKPWFEKAAFFERIWFPTRDAVEAAEEYLIGMFRPPYNTVHNPDKRPRRASGGVAGGEDSDNQA
ncbi:GIY-YIG nuclease family protein [Corynebacterium nuruki]|uniref:GIY-YIG nuclease family protein n=1 Tax=Corynebacterium nuruki TaxID=1032851 RepID=UPI0002485E3D|nr:GIY-YIG nuclease family protein [Corynebacterium nuruki]